MKDNFQFSIFNYQLDQVHTGSTGFTTHFFRPYTCLNFTDMGFAEVKHTQATLSDTCLLYTSPSPRDLATSRMPSSA